MRKADPIPVKCEHSDQPTTPLSTILQPATHATTINEEAVSLPIPFTNARYRAHVRVVDFHPPALASFARCREPTEYDCLSDNDADGSTASSASSSSSSSSDDDDDQPPTVSQYAGAHRRIWEWRFALLLEDVSPAPGTQSRMWVVVDNHEAQMLLGMDASDLRRDRGALDGLRAQLFNLWGDLEEKKAQTRETHKKKQAAREEGQRRPGLQAPPVDSSDDEAGREGAGAEEAPPPGTQVRNTAFTCCIRQYGVKVREGHAAPNEDSDAAEENGGGRSYRWQRVFGLFGTKISS